MGTTEQMVSAVLYALADTIHAWTPALVFVLCALIIAIVAFIFDAHHD